MTYRLPLGDVNMEVTELKKFVSVPVYEDKWMQISQNEFSLTVEGTAHFYARDGRTIRITPAAAANQHTLELYLNGSVYGAILHQRKILPLHSSCFNYNGIGVMVCGESGAGKSSVTASFSLNGAQFLTDDVTPVLFLEGRPQIWAMSDLIKLWSDSLKQLNQQRYGLNRIDSRTDKYYFPMDSQKGKIFPLHQIFVLGIHDQPGVEFKEITGIEKFTTLYNEIYRIEYLQAMPETEAAYLKQLIAIAIKVNLVKVSRPRTFDIEKLRERLEEYITESAHARTT